MTEFWYSIARGRWNVRRDDTTSEELVVYNFMERGALLGIGREYALHKLASFYRNLALGWEFVLVVADTSSSNVSR